MLERVLEGCYGALIRAVDGSAPTQSVASFLADKFASGQLPQNGIVRDFARSLMELAAREAVLPNGLSIEQFRPPYVSDWPLSWPEENEIEIYRDSTNELPRLCASCLHDDFARYSVDHSLDNYDGLDLDAARRWIFQHVLDMGYTTARFRDFDRYLLRRYGGGRARPKWAERIGKKYQWIALYRLIARVADHLHMRVHSWDPPSPSVAPLQAPSERNIDPTVLVRASSRAEETAWWAPGGYDFAVSDAVEDPVWLETPDFPDSAPMVIVRHPESGEEWLVLYVNRDWRSSVIRRYDMPRRIMRSFMRCYMVASTSAERSWQWLARHQLGGENEPHALSFHSGFIGEYPWGVLHANGVEAQERLSAGPESLGPFPVIPTWTWLSPEHEFDAFHNENISIVAPSQRLMQDGILTWDGGSRYASSDGALSFFDPSLLEVGPAALLARKSLIDWLLRERDTSLIWTAVSEKQCLGESTAVQPYVWHTRAHIFRDGTIKSTTGVLGPRQGARRTAPS